MTTENKDLIGKYRSTQKIEAHFKKKYKGQKSEIIFNHLNSIYKKDKRKGLVEDE
jgi:hypothetical protein